jgi:hypothetical protein
MDLGTGRFVEKENALPTPESLYKLCDPEWMLEHFHDDLAVQLFAYAGSPNNGLPGMISDLDHKPVERLADSLDFPFDWGSNSDRKGQAVRLLRRYAQRATVTILDKARAFAKSRNKRLLVVLNYTARPDSFREPVVPFDGTRNDQGIIDHLVHSGFDYFDMNAVHQREYESMTRSYTAYMRQYHVEGASHYNPRGNHLFAYSIKNKLLELLDPKPLPYQDREAGMIDFTGYLHGA